MMIILPLQHIHMQRDGGILGETSKTVPDHLGAQVAHFLAREARVHVGGEVGAVGEVDDGAGEGFVERGVGGAEAC